MNEAHFSKGVNRLAVVIKDLYFVLLVLTKYLVELLVHMFAIELPFDVLFLIRIPFPVAVSILVGFPLLSTLLFGVTTPIVVNEFEELGHLLMALFLFFERHYI